MKFQPILTWFDERTGLVSGAKQCHDRKIAIDPCVCPMKLMPSAIIFCVILQAVSGFFLWSFYSPSTTTAWESVHYIQNDLSGGWLLRGVHHYSAQVLVFLLAVYIVGSVFRGLYRSPREFVFWIALLMGCLALGACLTGDLLGWTGLGYSATKVRTGFLQMIPIIGYDLYKLAIGGPGPDF